MGRLQKQAVRAAKVAVKTHRPHLDEVNVEDHAFLACVGG